MIVSRRGLLGFGGATAGGLLLAGCDDLARNQKLKAIVQSAEGASERFQRLSGRDALAQEFTRADMSPYRA